MILAPEMMIAVYNDRQIAEALIYQDTYIFTAVCADDGCLIASGERLSLNDQGRIIKKEKQSEVT